MKKTFFKLASLILVCSVFNQPIVASQFGRHNSGAIGSLANPDGIGKPVAFGSPWKPDQMGKSVAFGSPWKPDQMGKSVAFGSPWKPSQIGNSIAWDLRASAVLTAKLLPWPSYKKMLWICEKVARRKLFGKQACGGVAFFAGNLKL
jgi:hypothetical protein